MDCVGTVCSDGTSSAVMASVQASAARYNISSVIFRVPDTEAASPMPGKMYMLLHCDGIFTLPSAMVTGSNGDPVATTARPSVQAYACSGVHSALMVGLDMGMITGRWGYYR